jgi:ParB family transcriptional regulator, chromosome partitioning protein
MATKKKVLGRGLGALLPSAPAPAGDRTFLEIPIEQIVPNKYQPRSDFKSEELKQLSQSIKSNGVIQPIIVRKSGSQYQLIAGERRWRAAQMAGYKTIPAVLQDVSEYRTLELALIENIQRQDLNPIEEAAAYASLMERFHLSQEEVAQRVGKDRSSVANYLRLLKLPAEIKEQIQRQELSMGHARALISMEKARDQLALAEKIVRDQLNVRQTEQLTRNWKSEKSHGKPSVAAQTKDTNTRAAEQKLQEYLGTRVAIHRDSRDKGKIEVHFENEDDLIRIYELIMPGGGN